MTLRELLSYIEFDYEVENGEIKLVDLQQVYLGDIADFRVDVNSNKAAEMIVDRCSVYWEDYVIRPLEDDIGQTFDDWQSLYNAAKEKYDDKVNEYTILYWLLNPDEVEIEHLC